MRIVKFTRSILWRYWRRLFALRCNALNVFPCLVVKPLVDVGIIAGCVLHELVLDGAQLVHEAVVLFVQGIVLTLQIFPGFLQLTHPLLLLLTTFGRSDPVTFKELAAFDRLIQSIIFALIFLLQRWLLGCSSLARLGDSRWLLTLCLGNSAAAPRFGVGVD